MAGRHLAPPTEHFGGKYSEKMQETSSRRWRLSWSALAIVLVLLTGTGILLYPSISSWIYQYNQSKILDRLVTDIQAVDPPGAEQLELARRYNQALQFGAQVEADHRLPTGFGINGDESLNYTDILSANPEGIMGRIRFPVADVDLPIYHGTSDEVLLKGIGHLEGTSLPVGGRGTHAVLTGHRGLADAIMFTNLDRVKKGDRFTLEIFGQVLTYQVFSVVVVAPDNTESLRADPDKDLVTLITCTPLGINSHRILVTGERIIPTPVADVEQAGKTSDLPSFPWWVLVIGAVLVCSLVFLWRSGRVPAAGECPRQSARGHVGETDNEAESPSTAHGGDGHPLQWREVSVEDFMSQTSTDSNPR